MTRPYVILSVAVSIDGYIDDASDQRLLLSNAEDFDRVDAVRADVDAILIGAQTIRSDNPRLLVNSDARRAERVVRGLPEFPLKVTVTRSGNLGSGYKFWHHGGEKIVYTSEKAAEQLKAELSDLATIVALGSEEVDVADLLDDLGERGISRLMVEGGGHMHTEFLRRNLADELHLAIAPILVGQSAAPRFLLDATYPIGRMKLIAATTVGDVALLQYAPKDRLSSAM